MALTSQSLFLYGYQITVTNPNLDFKAAVGGPTLTAVIPLGQYSLTSLLEAIVTAMEAVDTAHTYTAVADRTVMGGTQNRVTLATSGTFLSLLFSSGPNANTSVASLVGFNAADYTGATSYTGAQSTGTVLIPDYIGYSYLAPTRQQKVFGAVNVSAAGVKEAVVYNIQQFLSIEFKYETSAKELSWQSLWQWLIQQRPFDLTPEITKPSIVYQLTLESSEGEQQGLGFEMKEMLPSFPNLYQTGEMKCRIVPDYTSTVFSTG